MMDDFESERKRVVELSSVGYFNYCITVTFKPDLCYSTLHPKKGSVEFAKVFQRYASRYPDMKYYLAPELSDSGMLHYHGIVMFKDKEYTSHEKTMKLFRNYLNRKFGRSFAQRIISYFCKYKVQAINKRECTTSFDKVWLYIHKDHIEGRSYKFLKIVHNL